MILWEHDQIIERWKGYFGKLLIARGGNLAKIPPNQVIDDFGRGSSVESESE